MAYCWFERRVMEMTHLLKVCVCVCVCVCVYVSFLSTQCCAGYSGREQDIEKYTTTLSTVKER